MTVQSSGSDLVSYRWFLRQLSPFLAVVMAASALVLVLGQPAGAQFDPGVDIEVLTNGNQADGVNDSDVPQIAAGAGVTWTYIVTNTGDVAFNLADVVVTDDIIGTVTGIVDQGNGDDVLSSGEVWTYETTAVAGAEDLANPAAGTVIVSGCNPDGTPVPGDRATYENIGTVTVPGDSDADPSHYCNPLDLDTDNDGVDDVDDVCPATVLPDEPTRGLKKNRYAASVDGFASTNGVIVATLADTGGCSASQIIAGAGLGAGHTKFGISASALQGWIDALNA